MTGLNLYRRNPRFLGALGVGYSLLTLFLMMILMSGGPVLATVLVPALWLCIPALWVGVLNGCRAVATEEGRLTPALLFSGFRRHPKRLVSLGGLHFAGWLVVVMAFVFLGGAGFLRALMSGEAGAMEAVDPFGLLTGGAVAALLALPLVMACWFAPLLLAWNDLSVPKALFFSLVACRRNLGAFTVYGLAWFGVMLGLPLIGALLALILTPGISRFILSMVQMIVVTPILFASIYTSYQDIFLLPLPDPEPVDAA